MHFGCIVWNVVELRIFVVSDYLETFVLDDAATPGH